MSVGDPGDFLGKALNSFRHKTHHEQPNSGRSSWRRRLTPRRSHFWSFVSSRRPDDPMGFGPDRIPSSDRTLTTFAATRESLGASADVAPWRPENSRPPGITPELIQEILIQPVSDQTCADGFEARVCNFRNREVENTILTWCDNVACYQRCGIYGPFQPPQVH